MIVAERINIITNNGGLTIFTHIFVLVMD